MKPSLAIVPAAIPLLASACSIGNATACKGISRREAIELAIAQKHRMLGRSAEAVRRNFAGDATIPTENNGFAATVGFKGKDGRTLVALIYDDCYVGWTDDEPQ